VRAIWLLLGGVAVAATARAETLGPPRISPNDTWTYQSTVEGKTGWHQTHVEATVEHAGAGGIATSQKQVGSTMPPTEHLAGADWSRSRNLGGHETVVNRPMAFPLSVGKTWEVEYTEANPNRQHTSEHIRTNYKVVGWEDVTVPAGNFHALKIEADGTWSAAIAPALTAGAGARVDAEGSTTVTQTHRIRAGVVSGRLYKAFWYVPTVKRWVKSVEEYYDSNDTRTSRFAEELESYKVAE